MKTHNQYRPQSVSHPGETLQEKLDEMGMGPKEFALRTAKPEKTITAILKGDSSITPDMAVQFENATQIPAQFWLNRQRLYDEYMARIRNQETIQAALDWTRLFPVSEMSKKGWIPTARTIEEKTACLLAFFGFSNHSAWDEYYFNKQLKVSFRISLAHTKEAHAVSAWLRKGELQATALKAAPYSEKKLKETLPSIKSLMATHPKDFFTRLQQACLHAGVKVVYTPCLPKAPINGSTRWINDTPVIQLTGRYKRNDIFWFTFFHEAGHILLHGKKDIFLENIDYSDKDKEKEQEADEFAVKWTLTESELDQILELPELKDEDIIQFARKFKTHPGVIIGRLQHEGLLPRSLGNHFVEPVELE